MSHKISNVIAFIISVVSLLAYTVTEYAPFAVISLFNVVLSAESAILHAIEKSKEDE